MAKQEYPSCPVMILAGGLGTRLREETEFRPKPMVRIGHQPILWHIMKLFDSFGFREFIILLGYKGECIREYFLSGAYRSGSLTFHTKGGAIKHHVQEDEVDWKVTLVETGIHTMTGSRVRRGLPFVNAPRFFLCYGDGLADIPLLSLMKFHLNHQGIATMTGVKASSRFGIAHADKDRKIVTFGEKEMLSERVNAGFFLLEREVEQYLGKGDEIVFEQEPLHQLTEEGQCYLFEHNGFWQCMDTSREHQLLTNLWHQKSPPWRIGKTAQTAHTHSNNE